MKSLVPEPPNGSYTDLNISEREQVNRAKKWGAGFQPSTVSPGINAGINGVVGKWPKANG